MNKSREELVCDFHKAFGAAIHEEPTVEILELRKTLIQEEVKELCADIDTAIAYLQKNESVPKISLGKYAERISRRAGSTLWYVSSTQTVAKTRRSIYQSMRVQYE